MDKVVLIERNIIVSEEVWYYNDKINTDQQVAYNRILSRVIFNKSGAFFTFGLGGTVKIFFASCVVGYCKALRFIALTTITSGVVASLFPGGLTTYSCLKITYRNWWKYYLRY